MSYAKMKGTKFESDIVNYLIECGFEDARRCVLHGSNDIGDIQLGPVNNPTFIIECKNYAKDICYKQIEDFVQEAHTEYCNAKHITEVNPYCALLCVKRVNLGTADSWLIWKNDYRITIRCRLGDVINKEGFAHCLNYDEKLLLLENVLRSR